MRNPARRITHNINKHRHPRRKVPQNMAMEEPHAGIIGAEAKYRIAAAGDLNCIAEGGAGEIVGLEGRVFWVGG
jgi:hypothetical protein